MAKIEQNGYYPPPLGTPKTTQDGCIAARFLSFAAIAGDSLAVRGCCRQTEPAR